LDSQIIDAAGLERLQRWDNNKDGKINIKEFAAFFASEMLQKNVEMLAPSTADAKSPPPLPEKWEKELPPLLFRLAARQNDMIRIFNLLKRMFDVFDSNHNHRIDKKEMKKLVQIELFTEKEIEALYSWKTTSRESINFNEFLAFWIAHAIDFGVMERKDSKAPSDAKKTAPTQTTATPAVAPTKQTAKEVEQKKAADAAERRERELAPLLLRLASERTEIKKVFDLVRKFFNALDENKDGYIDRLELATLLQQGFLEPDAAKKLMDCDINHDLRISLNEFVMFLANELAAADGRLT